MKKVVCVGLGLALVLALSVAATSAEKDKDPSIKEIMTKAHKGGNSLIEKLGTELKSDEPKWDDVQKQTKELVDLGKALGKNKPPQGTKESWDKLTKKYLDEAEVLNKAADKKDKADAAAAQKTLKTYCADCHSVHKPKEKE